MEHGKAIVALLACLAALSGIAQTPDGALAATPELGFPAESVTSLYQDAAGFLWLGTREGLILYDGHSFEVFDHDVTDPTSLSDNTVRTIYEDREGTLWLGTTAGGLNRMDRATWTFRHYRHDSADPGSLSNDSVNAILQDREGSMWVGAQVGLNRLDPTTGTFERFRHDPADPHSLAHDYVYALHEDDHGILWIGTVGGGLNRYDPATGRFSSFRHDPADPRTLSNDSVFAIAEDEQGALWLGTEAGVDRFDPASGLVDRLDAGDSGPGAPTKDLITVLSPGPAGTLWVGTWGGGARVLETRTRTFRDDRLSRDPDLADDRIVSLLLDRTGFLWLGTWGEGLKRVPPTRDVFSTIGVTGEPDGLSHRDATALHADRDGGLWVGTWGRGVDRRERGAGTFRNYLLDEESGATIGTVLALHRALDGHLWVGTMGGLTRLDPDSGRMRSFVHDSEDPTSLGAGYVNAITEDHDGRLWVATGEDGLNRLRPDGGSFERFEHDSSDARTLSDDYVTAILEDGDGRIWVGTRSGGLNVLDAARERFDRYLPDAADPRSVSHHYISSIAQGDDGVIWIATAGGGLNRAEPAADGGFWFSRFTERDGLVDDDVMSVSTDVEGSLWLATKDGLSRFEPASGRFTTYAVGDGLPTNDFNVGSVAGSATTVWLGSSAGVLAIQRGAPFPSPRPSTTLLRSISTLDGPLRADRPTWELERLELPYGEILTLEFAVLDFGEPRHHRYTYLLEGWRDEWVDLGNRHEITFTDLDPGAYTLRVRGRNDEGVWSEAATALAIDVVPPFWMTTWFRFLIVAVVAAAALLTHRVRLAALERRNRELQRLKDQRERALDEARANEEALHKAYDQLRDLTGRLEAAKEDERKHIARELHDEMGQALTAAKLNLQLLPAVPDAEAAGRRIADTVDLVDRMIGHVRTLSLSLRPPLLDELGLLPALRGYLEAQAARAGLEIDVRAGAEPKGLRTDIEITAFRAVQEAVTNIIRHADARHVVVEVGAADGSLTLRVRDDGRGFDVPAALERASGGQHLGLLGIRERVQSLGGEVTIESAPGHGTEVSARIPVAA